MRTLLAKMILLPLSLAGFLISGCTAHERFHHDLAELHEEFHEYPHNRAAHEQFHEDLQLLHDEVHARGSYDHRFLWR